MINAFKCATLPTALEKLKQIVKEREKSGKKTVIFCEDRLSLAAERTVCAAVEGTFLTSVYTFARFLSSEAGKCDNVLSSQGSAMAIRKIIDERRGELTTFKKLSSAGAAQTVYDTIALLYSSRVSAEDAYKAAERGGFLGGKLRDLAVIYSAYQNYLQQSGKQDRNGYLRGLADVIEKSPKILGSLVVFLGFQAFTSTVTECARAAFNSAESVCGLFIGGKEEIYVNEAAASFIKAAEDFGGARVYEEAGVRGAEAEALRRGLFNPESFYSAPTCTERVRIYEAEDEEEELEFIAASIKKHVLDGGERYAKISVMLPDLEDGERALSRVFSRFRIPYYADRQIPLSAHPLCDFVTDLLVCVISGCRFKEVDGVVSSPFFPAARADKDIFRNYALRLASFRGGVKREPDKEILKGLEFDFEAVERVRKTFLRGQEILTANGVGLGIFAGLRDVLKFFNVEEKLKDLAENFRDVRPTAAQFGARAYESVLSVLSEAESLVFGGVQLKELVKILKSGFAATKISLIPPKADAVFVGDLAATANTGSNVIFAARLCGDVPPASADTALLTDREISALEEVNLNISPKIRQVNARRRETVALNLCAFREQLYLSYPARLGAEESAASEIVSYAQALFLTPSGNPLKPVGLKKVERSGRAAPYYCSEKLPAIKRLQRFYGERDAASVYEVLCRRGFKQEADLALSKSKKRNISCGQPLYLTRESISPTALETYFSCPYLSFVRQGLKAREREEGAVRAVDSGNFIHSVLQDLAPRVNEIQSAEKFEAEARAVSLEKLKKPPYSSLQTTKSGQYTAGELVFEAARIAAGMYEQLKNSAFGVWKTECGAEVELFGGVKVYGRIDRVDEGGGMVRIIDYKTGAIDAAASKYYSGAKLQLPLYLLAVSEGRRAVGAYYFPAAVTYGEKQDGVFRLQGFMDGSDEVVAASDTTVSIKQKSSYVNAYLGAKQPESAMPKEDFFDFLEYSRLVAGGGAREMVEGNIAPSPAGGACEYCKAGGSCGFTLGRDGDERKMAAVKCGQIAEISRRARGIVKKEDDIDE